MGIETAEHSCPCEDSPDEVLEAPQITAVVYCEKLIGLYVLLTGSSGLIY